jgi:hypothetical protein
MAVLIGPPEPILGGRLTAPLGSSTASVRGSLSCGCQHRVPTCQRRRWRGCQVGCQLVGHASRRMPAGHRSRGDWSRVPGMPPAGVPGMPLAGCQECRRRGCQECRSPGARNSGSNSWRPIGIS